MEVAKDGSGLKIPYPIQRWDETLEVLRMRGFEAFETSLLPVPPVVMQNRLWLQACMEGPDVYCNDTWLCDPTTSATKDGKLNSVNGFGRLEIEAYPYCLKIFWDGAGHDHAELPSWGHHSTRIQEFLSIQQQPEVKRMRNVRQWIRGAAESGQLLYLVKTWIEQKTRQVPDGHDSEGNAKTKTEHYEVHYTGTHGLLSVRGDYGDSKFEQGFNVSMHYSGASGVERGGSQSGQQHSDGTKTFPAASIGIDHRNYNMTSDLNILLLHQNNRNIVQQGLTKYQNQAKQYRQTKVAERYWDNWCLSWSFWYLIYNNDLVTHEILNQHFLYIEQNPVVKRIPQKYKKELHALLKIIERFNCNPAVGYWYLYWHDVYLHNSDLPGIKKNEEIFNPSTQKSIAFLPMGREACNQFLNALGTNVLGKKQTEHLDRLYKNIDNISIKHAPIVGTLVVQGTPSRYAVSSDHGGGAWAGFAQNAIATGANPSNVAILNPQVGVVWMDDNKNVGY